MRSFGGAGVANRDEEPLGEESHRATSDSRAGGITIRLQFRRGVRRFARTGRRARGVALALVSARSALAPGARKADQPHARKHEEREELGSATRREGWEAKPAKADRKGACDLSAEPEWPIATKNH